MSESEISVHADIDARTVTLIIDGETHTMNEREACAVASQLSLAAHLSK